MGGHDPFWSCQEGAGLPYLGFNLGRPLLDLKLQNCVATHRWYSKALNLETLTKQ
jgi:hypothetical protein